MYLGRVVGFGLNEDSKPFGIYAVSGRSEGSKARRAEIKDNTIEIGPIGDISQEQEEMKDLIFYPAIITNDEERYAIVSNGIQTNYISEERMNDNKDIFSMMANSFKRAGGAEPDEYGTPRIGGYLDLSEDPEMFGGLGIVTNTCEGSCYLEFEKCKVNYISTYEGDNSDSKNIIIPDLKNMPAGKFWLSGKNAQELANNMYKRIDSDLVVCSAAALWLPEENRWELAIKNLHD